MNKIALSLYLFLAIISLLSDSYCLTENNFSFSPGYKRENFSLNTTDSKEKSKKFSLPAFNQKGVYFFTDHWQIGEAICYGAGKSHHDNLIQTISYNNQDIQAPFMLKANAHSLNTELFLGYSIRFAPIYILPSFGFSYDLLSIRHKNIRSYSYSLPLDTLFIRPYGKISSEYYLPFLRFSFTMQPGVDAKWQFTPSYSFFYGRAKHTTGYEYAMNSSWTKKSKTFRKKAHSHLIDIETAYVMNRFSLGIKFSWQIYKTLRGSKSPLFRDASWQKYQTFFLISSHW